ncbi:hypothetical protein ES705_11967 [subsurface metagenome]
MKRIFSISNSIKDLIKEFESELSFSLFLNFYGHIIEIHTNSIKLFDHFNRIYIYFVNKNNEKISLSKFYALEENSHEFSSFFHRIFPNRNFRGNLLISEELNLIFLISKYNNLAYTLANFMMQTLALKTSKHYLNIHAATIIKDKTCFLFPGSQHCGKTTISIELIKRGYKLLSDDFSIINRKTLKVLPFPRALNIREDTLPLISKFRNNLISASEFKIAGEKRWFLDLTKFCGELNVPNLIVFLQLNSKKKSKLEQYSKVRAVLDLIGLIISPYLPGLLPSDPQSNLDIIAKLINNGSVYRLTFGDIDNAIDLLLNLEVDK